jgi:hypothetical protein
MERRRPAAQLILENGPRWLLNHRARYYSEYGEDGVLNEMLRRITPARYFVEFGAWDGRHGSNTFFLAERGFAGCMIEGDAGKFAALQANMAAYPSVRCVHSYVEPSGPESLDAILSAQGAPQDFDVLSIDIDGDDYWVWKGLSQYRPKIVVIELNWRVRPGISHINPLKSPFEYGVSGTSITAMRDLGESKGYKLVVNVGCNAIFVDAPLYSLFQRRQVSEHDLFTYEGFRLSELRSAREVVRRLTEYARRLVNGRP